MNLIKADHLAAARLSITPEEVARHRNAGRHLCVDGRWYTTICLVADPTCTAVARHRLHPEARLARVGELVRVVGFGGARESILDGAGREVSKTYHLRVQLAVARPAWNWDQVDGVIEQPDQPRIHGEVRSLFARPHHYDIVN